MTDAEFYKIEQEFQSGYDEWGAEFKAVFNKWVTKHQAAYFAFEYPRKSPYLRKRVFNVIFSDLSDEQKLIELEKILPHDGSIYL